MLVPAVANKIPLLKEKSVAIIGAGIGGLSVSNALLYQNSHSPTVRKHQQADDRCLGLKRVTVYDQAASFSPTAGAGFGFSPNGQLCLSSIGIDGYHDLIHPYTNIVRITKEGTSIRNESDLFQQIYDRYGFTFGGCLRADIVQLLVDHLQSNNNNNNNNNNTGSSSTAVAELKYSHKLTKIHSYKDKVELEFENGAQDVVDLVIGADGIHTYTAKTLNIDHSEPIYAGANIFYGKIENPDSIPFANSFISQDGHIVNGPGPGEFLNFRVGPPTRKTHIWVATYPSTAPPDHRQQEWEEDGSSPIVANRMENDLDTLLSQFPSSNPIHELVQHTDRENNILHFGLYYRQHKSTWFKDRVVLLGDSCHATLPYVGQGANQAIEDAIVLADCLATATTTSSNNNNNATTTMDDSEAVHEAFSKYYAIRFPRTKRIVGMANILNKGYHSQNPLVQWCMNLLLDGIVRGGVMFKQVEREILQEGPIKDFSKFQRPKK